MEQRLQSLNATGNRLPATAAVSQPLIVQIKAEAYDGAMATVDSAPYRVQAISALSIHSSQWNIYIAVAGHISSGTTLKQVPECRWNYFCLHLQAYNQKLATRSKLELS